MQELIKASKALSNKIRVRMLKLLLEKDICVCEMNEIMPISNSQVSRGLTILMDAGFLKRWNEGKCVVYKAERINSSKYCRKLLDLIAECFDDDNIVLRDRKKLKQVIAMQVREKRR